MAKSAIEKLRRTSTKVTDTFENGTVIRWVGGGRFSLRRDQDLRRMVHHREGSATGSSRRTTSTATSWRCSPRATPRTSRSRPRGVRHLTSA